MRCTRGASTGPGSPKSRRLWHSSTGSVFSASEAWLELEATGLAGSKLGCQFHGPAGASVQAPRLAVTQTDFVTAFGRSADRIRTATAGGRNDFAVRTRISRP